MADVGSQSMLKDEVALHWSFLDAESDGFAVVSERMELLFVNTAARALVFEDWFAKRCWEAFPTKHEECLLRCPTIQAMGKGDEIRYQEEVLEPEGKSSMRLGVAMIPLPAGRPDKAAALLLLRPRDDTPGEVSFRSKVLAAAIEVRSRLEA